MFDHHRRGYSTLHVRDLHNALVAVLAASRHSMRYANSHDAEIFQDGFRAAVEAVAAAFGLDPLTERTEPAQPQLPRIIDITPRAR